MWTFYCLKTGKKTKQGKAKKKSLWCIFLCMFVHTNNKYSNKTVPTPLSSAKGLAKRPFEKYKTMSLFLDFTALLVSSIKLRVLWQIDIFYLKLSYYFFNLLSSMVSFLYLSKLYFFSSENFIFHFFSNFVVCFFFNYFFWWE